MRSPGRADSSRIELNSGEAVAGQLSLFGLCSTRGYELTTRRSSSLLRPCGCPDIDSSDILQAILAEPTKAAYEPGQGQPVPPACCGTSRLREGRTPSIVPALDQQVQCCHHTHPALRWCRGIMLEDSQMGTLGATTSTSIYHHIGTSMLSPLRQYLEGFLGHCRTRILLLTFPLPLVSSLEAQRQHSDDDDDSSCDSV